MSRIALDGSNIANGLGKKSNFGMDLVMVYLKCRKNFKTNG